MIVEIEIKVKSSSKINRNGNDGMDIRNPCLYLGIKSEIFEFV